MMVFRAFARLRLGRDLDLEPLAITAFEEPETHLHPQSQRSVLALLGELGGQTLLSTHSPLLAASSSLADLRLFRRDRGKVTLHYIDKSRTDVEDLESARRKLFKQGGEALFAKLTIIFEGETEQDALPVFAEAFWGEGGASGRGISLVAASGAQTVPDLALILDCLGLPWLALLDGDAAGQDAVSQIIKKLQEHEIEEKNIRSRIFMLSASGKGEDFEAYLATDEYRGLVEEAVGEIALEDFKRHHDGKPGKKGKLNDYSSESGWENRLVADFLRQRKVYRGRQVAEKHMVKSLDAEGNPLIPEKIYALFVKADQLAQGGP